MKKLFTLMAAAVVAVSASAQTVEGSKAFDNIYVGINGGVATKTTHNRWMKNLNPNAGIRVGKYFTPVFGVAIEGNAYFSNKPYTASQTVVRGLNLELMPTVNLTNWFGGYNPDRLFEVVAMAGFGWGHTFGNRAKGHIETPNDVTSKGALDFVFNLGSNKAWQVYLEPSIIWGLRSRDGRNAAGERTLEFGRNGAQYNINGSMVQLNAGVNYKFKTSNGTHNFKIAEVRDQSEIDELNNQINNLRDQLAKKPKEVVKTVYEDVPAPAQKEVKVENLYFVTFAQGKSVLTKDAKKALDAVPAGSHVQIVGTASPEGSKAFNDRLSQARADVVAKYLSDKGVVVDEATGKGVQGTTSGRLAIVYIK